MSVRSGMADCAVALDALRLRIAPPESLDVTKLAHAFVTLARPRRRMPVTASMALRGPGATETACRPGPIRAPPHARGAGGLHGPAGRVCVNRLSTLAPQFRHPSSQARRRKLRRASTRRPVIGHHHHLLAVSQIDPGDGVRGRHRLTQPGQPGVTVAITPGYTATVRHGRPPLARGIPSPNSASGGRLRILDRHAKRLTIPQRGLLFPDSV